MPTRSCLFPNFSAQVEQQWVKYLQGVNKKLGLQNPDNPDIFLTFLAKNPDIFSILTKGKYFGGTLLFIPPPRASSILNLPIVI